MKWYEFFMVIAIVTMGYCLICLAAIADQIFHS